ncbi:MAG: tyrosine-type recombinase/integrase [Acidimicrobiales bacterium]
MTKKSFACTFINRLLSPGASRPWRPDDHELRHTYASIAASCGASVKVVQTQLGHADPALTLRLYQHSVR